MRGKVDIGGRRLQAEVAGTGSPVIIFEAGAGSASDTWDPIWTELTGMTRCVRYDRANLGGSDPEPDLRSARHVVSDLSRLLAALEVSGPYILVGHSLGGIFVRLFRDRHPDQVAGLVLIDSSHQDQIDRFLQLLPSEAPGEPDEVRARRARYTNPDYQSPEGVRYRDSLRDVVSVAPLGDLPMVVLSRAITPADRLARQSPGYPEELAVAGELAWHELQRDLLTLSTRSRHLIAEQSGHYIHQDQPDLVIQAVRQMIAELRREAPAVRRYAEGESGRQRR